MSWPTLFANPPADLELRYRTGTKRAPEGESLLVVHGAGVATLERWRGGARTLTEGRLSAAEVRALFASLGATGFPDVVAQTVPPGPGMIALEIGGGPEQVPLLMHRSFVRDLPAWSALVQRLDGLLETLAAGATR